METSEDREERARQFHDQLNRMSPEDVRHTAVNYFNRLEGIKAGIKTEIQLGESKADTEVDFHGPGGWGARIRGRYAIAGSILMALVIIAAVVPYVRSGSAHNGIPAAVAVRISESKTEHAAIVDGLVKVVDGLKNVEKALGDHSYVLSECLRYSDPRLREASCPKIAPSEDLKKRIIAEPTSERGHLR